MSTKRNARSRRRRRLEKLADRKRRPWVITGTFLAVLSFAALICTGACKKRGHVPLTAEERLAAEQEQARTRRDWADAQAADITYFRDARSGLCFAYLYVSYNSYADNATGGPAMSEVDCAKVEKFLVNAPAESPR